MAAELRWILAALSAGLLAGIWWWGARRSRQAPGDSELRESMVRPAEPAVDEPAPAESAMHDSPSGDWGVPPFEPLSIRTADFDQVPLEHAPMSAQVDALEETFDLGVSAAAAALPAAASSVAAPDAPGPSAAPLPSPQVSGSGQVSSTGEYQQVPNASETQRIVTIRLAAADGELWAGTDLLAALENHGLAFGRYNVFHRKHTDGRTLFCAASLVEPGTFDPSNMPQEQYRGLTLFAVLPGPTEPLQTLEALIETAGDLARSLHGAVHDSKGLPFSQQHAAALREDIARFQDSLVDTQDLGSA